MSDEALDLYNKLRADDPEDFGKWIGEHVPLGMHIQTWGAVSDLLKTDAMYALADPDNHSRRDFDRAVDFLVAAMDSRRIPADSAVAWLGIYVTTAERYGLRIEHLAFDPDAFGRRILSCLPSFRPRELKYAQRSVGEEEVLGEASRPDLEERRAMRRVQLELAWAAPRVKDPQLALAIKEWIDFIRDL